MLVCCLAGLARIEHVIMYFFIKIIVDLCLLWKDVMSAVLLRLLCKTSMLRIQDMHTTVSTTLTETVARIALQKQNRW